ncbi:subclass B3 metallo-beta-lactamase [Novosphingobium mangrovi (ex Hu et al. 2023)]|uniref:Subclass B3 metallo-beta-lactamase n=1 Tax=Novosphingobium mangrovi (ex Hu et al. 2023) TaxID=2930094 RepID=A0ABT0A7C0_9SPHN|nr:subclass B3 metallo-beta-lactamase [Novosphingobium mangrovi (ex Hu et al. 2023)]MCJ1959068.1 subclass B3 metallo-beta-lactamase [Novosphingobium mangrovi (ex Hu et al. 2023)]
MMLPAPRAPCRRLLWTPLAVLGAGALALGAPHAFARRDDAPGARLAQACAGRDGWAEPAPPARIAPETGIKAWYVGTCGITALLLDTGAGLVLIDSGVAEAAPLVLGNIRKLGFDPREVRWLLGSHEHHDHVGGHGAVQRATGAKVAALAVAARSLTRGKITLEDPQRGAVSDFAPIRVDRVLADGEGLVVGSLVFTPHATPAHTPGSTSWTIASRAPGASAMTLAYADSATTVSAKGYRFHEHPERVTQARAGFTAIAALPCDVLVTPHPSASNLFARLSGSEALIDPQACVRYAARASDYLDTRLSQERANDHQAEVPKS